MVSRKRGAYRRPKHGRIANGRYGERLYHRAVQEGCGARPTSRILCCPGTAARHCRRRWQSTEGVGALRHRRTEQICGAGAARLARPAATAGSAVCFFRIQGLYQRPRVFARRFAASVRTSPCAAERSASPRRSCRSGRGGRRVSMRCAERSFAVLVHVKGRKSAHAAFARNREKRHENYHFAARSLCFGGLPIGTAAAGQCTTEIENMTKLLASRDAGAGPTAGAASPTTGQHPPSAAMGAADPSTAASSAATELGRPQHPPTATMNQATQGGGPPSQAGSSAREQHPPTAALSSGDSRRRRFAAGCAEPEPRRAHRGSAGGRCPPARVRELGGAASRTQ